MGDIASATKTDKKMINNAVTKQKYDQIYETIVWKGVGGGGGGGGVDQWNTFYLSFISVDCADFLRDGSPKNHSLTIM